MPTVNAVGILKVKMMYYGEIKNCDIANGIGVRVSLFVSGCTNHCEECFQPQTWAFDYGKPFTEETEADILRMLAPDYIDGLTLLGGEPFEPANQRVLLPFIKKVKETYPRKTIWCFTGFLMDKELQQENYARCEVTDQMLSMIDVLVDGRFVKNLYDISLRFRGSSNQRIIDVPKTLQSGQITPWEG
jgi:anaerobic ribonucleoside-triphosphate reductase activating protein